MDEKFFIDVLEENKGAVKTAVREAMLDGIKKQFEWELPSAVKQEVAKFVEEEIVPSIRAELMESKDEMVAAATEIIRGVPIELGKAMQEQVAKNLSNSWNIKKVVDALLN